MVARALRIVAVTSVSLFGAVAALFIVGETLADPGGWRAVALTATWAVPLVALSVLVLAWPRVGAWVLPLVVAVVAAAEVVDSIVHLVDRDAWGPVGSVSMLAVLVPCGLLGARRAAEAGILLLAGAAAQLVATVASMDRAGGQPLRSALGGSTGVLVVPLLVFGALFLGAAAAERWTGPHGLHRPATQSRH